MKKVYCFMSLFVIGLGISFNSNTPQSAAYITDRVGTQTLLVQGIKKPQSLNDLQEIVTTSSGPLSIAGKRYSQGGQTVGTGGTMINMSHFNKIINLDIHNKTITVQPGITWRAIQEAIDPHNLSVIVMQSYNDFSVGGSLSVNAHSRELKHGSIVNTVKSIVLLTADGNLLYADRVTNPTIFKSAIGGYGLLGIIVEATLELTDNIPLRLEIHHMPLSDYRPFFKHLITTDPNAVFHNALLWPTDFNTIMASTYYKTHAPVNVSTRLRVRQLFYLKNIFYAQLLRRIPLFQKIRPKLQPMLIEQPKEIIWRNYEMSYSVKELAPLFHFPSTTILQEYFVPEKDITTFINQLNGIIKQQSINVVNASIRHVPADTTTLLTYAPQESFAIVLYINIWNTTQALEYAKKWTQQLIDVSLSFGGAYYLPYHIFATKEQFNRAYRGWQEFLRVKKQLDPQNRFKNMLFEAYG